MKRGIGNMYLEDKNACCFLWQLLDVAIEVYGLDMNIFSYLQVCLMVLVAMLISREGLGFVQKIEIP